jgi:hypothetical protein
MEHPGQIDRYDAVPSRWIEVEKSGGLTDAHAVEQHVEPAEFAHRRGNRGVNGRAVAHVEAERPGTAARGANLRSGRLGRGGIYIGTGYCCAFTPETQGARPADPPTRTSYERDLSLDPPHAAASQYSIGYYRADSERA